jgi:hypothetical protein
MNTGNVLSSWVSRNHFKEGMTCFQFGRCMLLFWNRHSSTKLLGVTYQKQQVPLKFL